MMQPTADPELDLLLHNPKCLTLADVSKLEERVQEQAIRHMDGVWEAHCHRKTHVGCGPLCPDAPDDPAFQDFCGCGTCVVREILMSGYQTLRVLAQMGMLTGEPKGEA